MTAEYFAPAFQVRVNGDAVATDVSKYITELSVTVVPDGIDQLELTLANPYPELRWTHVEKDAELFKEGNSITVSLGYTDALEPMFDGEITGLTPSFPEGGAPTLRVEGFNRLHRVQAHTEVIALPDATERDVVQKIADLAHLSAQVDDPGIEHPQLTTGGGTHLRYLLERARVVNREVWVEGKTLHFSLPRATAQPAYTLVWGRTRESFAPGSLPLLSFSPGMDLRQQVNEVVVRGEDPLTREPFEGRAGEGSEDTTLGGRQTGPQVRSAALGGPVKLVLSDLPVSSQPEAEALARAAYNERAMRFITGTGVTIGLPKLRPGTVVTLDGVGRFNGQYYVDRATHTLGDGGYRTTFSVRKNSLG